MSDKKYVTYEEYGAVGDGVHDDWEAIRDAHNFANERRTEGYAVKGKAGATYYIRDITKPTFIMTDVDWTDVSFTIDNRGMTKGCERCCRIFHVAPEFVRYSLSEEEIDEIFPGRKIDKDNLTRVNWKYGHSAMLIIFNKNNLQYRRMSGGMPAGGGAQMEIISVDKDGYVAKDTPCLFDYDDITGVQMVSTEDTPITIRGGKFTSIANDLPQYENFYIARGFGIKRSNTRIIGLEHYIVGELDGLTPDTRGASSSGFIFFEDCQNVSLEDAVLTGHRYYGFAGTYDFQGCLVNRVTLKNCKQSNFYMEDGRPSMHGNVYWGIGGTSYCKNMVYDGCMLSRFDAHAGVYNGKILNCTMNAIEIIGGGEMLIENTTFVLSRTCLIDLRTDYGSTWNGNITIKDCKVQNFNPKKTTILRGTWVNGYYGYDCHMPNLTVDNLVFDNVEAVDIMSVEVSPKWPEKRYDTLSAPTFKDGEKNENPYVPFDYVTVKNNNAGHLFRLYNAPYFDNVKLSGVERYDEEN